jgi:hypothetical protein
MLDRVMPTGWGGPHPNLRYLTEFASGITFGDHVSVLNYLQSVSTKLKITPKSMV